MTVQLIIDGTDKNLSKVSESLQYFTTLATFMCKFINFVWYKKVLLEIEDALTLSVLYDHSNHCFDLLQQKISTCRIVGKVFRIMVIGAVSLYGLTPYLDPEKHKTLPIPGWFPYNVNDYYYLTFAYQMVGVVNTAYTNSTIDILTWLLISVASGQFEILKENLRRIDYGNENVQETNHSFEKCVNHHKEIVR